MSFVAVQVGFASGSASQDRALLLLQEDRALVVVADGAGGTGFGARAAQAVVDLVVHEVVHEVAWSDPRVLVDLLTTLDGRLARERIGGESTAIVTVITREAIVGASVGDSEAHLVTADGALDLTASQVRKPLLGSGRAQPTAFAAHRSAGSTLVVATDGLFAYVDPARVHALSVGDDVAAAARALTDAARLPNGNFRDDVTVVVVRGL